MSGTMYNFLKAVNCSWWSWISVREVNSLYKTRRCYIWQFTAVHSTVRSTVSSYS